MSLSIPAPRLRGSGRRRRRPAVLAAAVLVSASAVSLVLASPAGASTGVCGAPVTSGATTTITCAAGGAGAITVPAGVTSMTVTLDGAGGGASDGGAVGGLGAAGGLGAQVVADLSVAPGATLDVAVGSQGAAGSYTGDPFGGAEVPGGSGGGLVAVTTGTGTPLLTAGSGGGSGGPDVSDGYAGGAGGNSDGPGATGCDPYFDYAIGGSGGSPGTATAGGAGGAGGVGYDNTGTAGSTGGFPNAAGGAGGLSGYDAAQDWYSADGGSGGAGYGGGGGGGGASAYGPTADASCGGGGGGGSSYVSGTVAGTTPTVTDGVNAGDGSVVFTYSASAPPAVTSISPASGPAAGGTVVTVTGTSLSAATGVTFGGTPATSFSCTATSCTATAPAEAAGTVDVTVTTAGGTSATSGADHYAYLAPYPFTGFFSPVDNLPTVNMVNAGQSIPIKFSLGSGLGLGIIAAGYPTAQTVSCTTGAPVNTATETDTAGGSGLQYDSGSDTYTYVWKTSKASAGTCQVLTLELTDGTTHTAEFQYK